MVSTKVGTQTWSKAPQKSGLEVDRSNYDPASKAAAAPSGPNSGDDKSTPDKVNEMLNPLSAAKPTRKPNNELGKDDFLKLMLAQIKHQDPTSPLQSHEMAAHLAQFTSLEQLFNVNKNLESLSKAQEPMQRYEVLNFLGKSVKADSKEIFWSKGDKNADLRFNLMADASKVKVTVIDGNGDEVRTIDTGTMKKGLNKVVWNGLDGKEQEARPGQYSFRVEAENTSGRKIGVETATTGVITGVNFTPEGPLLMVGDQKVRLQDIHKIEDEAQKGKNDLQGTPSIPNAEETAAGQAKQQVMKQAIDQITQHAKSKPAVQVMKEEAKPEVKMAANSKIPVDSSGDSKGEFKVGGGPFGH